MVQDRHIVAIERLIGNLM